jgi:hypothetical protein
VDRAEGTFARNLVVPRGERSTYWVTLYRNFDPHGTGEIGSALKRLATFKYIEVDCTIVTVTASDDMEQLAAECRPSGDTVCQSS